MGTYLVVGNETIVSPELKAALKEQAQQDGEAEFVLLLPATPVPNLLLREEGDPKQLAERRGASAQAELQKQGLRVSRALVGDASPMVSISEEVANNAAYKGIILGTHPPGISRWLEMDVPAKAKELGLPVTHMVVESVFQRTPEYHPRSPD
jgi:hypothetical protein